MNEAHLVSEIHASSQLLPGSCVTHMKTPLCSVHVLKEGVQDLQERQQWGEIPEAFHGR